MDNGIKNIKSQVASIGTQNKHSGCQHNHRLIIRKAVTTMKTFNEDSRYRHKKPKTEIASIRTQNKDSGYQHNHYKTPDFEPFEEESVHTDLAFYANAIGVEGKVKFKLKTVLSNEHLTLFGLFIVEIFLSVSEKLLRTKHEKNVLGTNKHSNLSYAMLQCTLLSSLEVHLLLLFCIIVHLH